MLVSTLTAEMRTHIGTPFHNGGRVSGPNGGIDCGGLLAVSLRNLGYEVVDIPNFNPKSDSIELMTEVLIDNNFINQGLPLLSEDRIFLPGNVAIVRGLRMNHHMVYFSTGTQLYATPNIIHAYNSSGINKVVEMPMPQSWIENIHSIWRLEGLEEG